MPKAKHTVLQPQYLKEFRCAGRACEDNCCDGRQTYVDKKTFLKYRRVEDKTLTPMFEKHVKRERDDENKSDENYAKILMTDDKCPFHDEQKLCLIQSKLGRDSLCNACAIYPRVYMQVDRKLERCGTMACPEIARIALSKPEGIALESVQEVDRIPLRTASLDTRLTRFAATPVKFFWEIRIFCLTLLQNRNYTLGQRLIIMGMFYKKIEELDKAENVEGIPAMLDTFAQAVEDGNLRPELEKIDKNPEIQMMAAKMLTDNQLSSNLAQAGGYLRCVMETLAGLKIVAGGQIEDSLKKYIENRDTHLSKYIKEKDYVLENFIVNEFFINLMPFGVNAAMWDSYLYLCVTYNLIRLHINGMSGYYGKLDDSIVFRLIQSFSKVTQHNKSHVLNIVEQLKAVGRDTQAWVAIMVND